MLIILMCMCILATEATQCKENQNCASCGKSGKCSSECDNGFYGPKCNLNCSTGCINNTCQVYYTGIGECTHGCKHGFYGTQCNIPCTKHENTCKKCPQACEGGLCQLGSSCAQGCQDSFYGTACKSCPAGCKVCNRVLGTCEVCLHCEGNCTQGCLEGCKSGYFGDFCEHSCSLGCLSGCDQISGDCFKCNPGWFGAFCENQCPNRCTDEECDMDGICTLGCSLGWFGPRCDNECLSSCVGDRCDRKGTCTDGCKLGFHGEQCQNKCPEFCHNKVCDVEDGSCKSCKKGFYDSQCNKSCVRCDDGACLQDTGHCIQGCLPNYREFCQHHCEGNCSSEECDECKSEGSTSSGIGNSIFIRYSIVGTVVLFVAMLLMYAACRFSRNSNKRRRSAQNVVIDGHQQPLSDNMSTDNRQPPSFYFQLDVADSTQNLIGTNPSINEWSISPLSQSPENVQNENETPLYSPEFFIADSNSQRQDAVATAKPVSDLSLEHVYLTAFCPSGEEEMFANCQAESGRQERDDEAAWNEGDSADQDRKADYEEIGILHEEESCANDTNAHVYVNFRGLYRTLYR